MRTFSWKETAGHIIFCDIHPVCSENDGAAVACDMSTWTGMFTMQVIRAGNEMADKPQLPRVSAPCLYISLLCRHPTKYCKRYVSFQLFTVVIRTDCRSIDVHLLHLVWDVTGWSESGWRWVVSFAPRPLYPPGERVPSTHWIGCYAGPRGGLDDVERRKILPLPGLELRPLGRPTRSQSFYWRRVMVKQVIHKVMEEVY
jgi:hypothetical protein